MKTCLSYFFILVSTAIMSQEYFQTSTNSTYLNKVIRNNGRIIIGDEHSNDHKFQVYSNTLANTTSVFGNSSGRLEISTVGVAGSYEPNSIAGDLVLKRLGPHSHNLSFFLGGIIPANSSPTVWNNFKFKFSSGTSPYSLLIYNTGKVTMGTELYDDSGYRLFVKDGIKTEKVKVEIASANGWADYVFEEDYNLMNLSDLKIFIDKNKHLPNIPSTAEVLDNGGVELKDITVKLLEKVEELTLYILQQQEEIKKLNLDIESLKSNQK